MIVLLQYLKNEMNKTVTENGAVTELTTYSDCLDLFATVGALREADEAEITQRFVRAYTENKDTATRILFYARDVRGGLGERRAFRICLNWLANNAPATVMKNIALISEYGRFDDLLALLGTRCEGYAIDLIRELLFADLAALERDEAVSLLAKWLPSINTSSPEAVKNAKRIARALGMSDAQYRKSLVALRARIRLLENNLRERDYTFDYEKQPSRALFKYRKAFVRNDSERYSAFLDRAVKGEAKLNASNIAPYELVRPLLTDNFYGGFMRGVTPEEAASLNATWASLTDFECSGNTLAVIDTSGSMYYSYAGAFPAAVALSLGLYFAEHNKGAFGGHFIEFSENPRLIEVKGDNFVDRLRYVASFNEIANTNIEALFDLVLDTAIKNDLPQSELPDRMVIISDMEFDSCCYNSELSNFENAKTRFEAAGYKLPQVVFWNVASRNRHQPVTMNEQGVTLLSGCTPRLFSMVTDKITTPYEFMIETLDSERYRNISA